MAIFHVGLPRMTRLPGVAPVDSHTNLPPPHDTAVNVTPSPSVRVRAPRLFHYDRPAVL